jgi:NADPH:quinone reductase-like Zn-dependent oxidoreductase
MQGKYPFPISLPIVPCSDASGTVLAVGPRVSRFKKGDKVCTLFNQEHIAGSLNPRIVGTGLGCALNGTLRKHGVFEDSGLVPMLTSLTAEGARTLSCAALTAWNALYGLKSKALKPGDVVLTQGTGGVSMFALQFAAAAGATVIATTSSEEKARKLKDLGAQYVINYKSDTNWGETAKKLTPDGQGADHILEVGGPTTMAQSLKAVKMDGVISIIGFLGGQSKDQPSFLECLSKICIVRGVLVGSRLQFEDMNQAIETNKIKPVVDERIFKLEEAKEAYQYMWEQKHFGKLVIKVD